MTCDQCCKDFTPGDDGEVRPVSMVEVECICSYCAVQRFTHADRLDAARKMIEYMHEMLPYEDPTYAFKSGNWNKLPPFSIDQRFGDGYNQRITFAVDTAFA